jgi:ABC-2 type transport system permease protein
MLPGWMQAVGEAVPSYHLGQLALAAVGMPVIGSVWLHGAIVAGMTVLAAIWAWAGWRRSPA